ncbi:hypothetical protein [Actinomadura sp. GTD37]|uniref:hypothetical protein n=1 Tax=Actinomadura sp. GTD37 TaxID=1778030 RepID=UPI0035BFEDDD
MAPWIDVSGTPHVLWELGAMDVVGVPGRLLPLLMMITLLLGVAASAAATRVISCVTWLVGCITVVSTFAFSFEPGDQKYDLMYGNGYAFYLSVAFVVVFFCVAVGEGEARTGEGRKVDGPVVRDGGRAEGPARVIGRLGHPLTSL